MLCAEQIVLNECDVAAISNRGLSRTPEKGQLKPRVFLNDVAQKTRSASFPTDVNNVGSWANGIKLVESPFFIDS
jgi:hypothetical protein